LLSRLSGMVASAIACKSRQTAPTGDDLGVQVGNPSVVRSSLTGDYGALSSQVHVGEMIAPPGAGRYDLPHIYTHILPGLLGTDKDC